MKRAGVYLIAFLVALISTPFMAALFMLGMCMLGIPESVGCILSNLIVLALLTHYAIRIRLKAGYNMFVPFYVAWTTAVLLQMIPKV